MNRCKVIWLRRDQVAVFPTVTSLISHAVTLSLSIAHDTSSLSQCFSCPLPTLWQFGLLTLKDFLFRCIKCTLLYFYHWSGRTISIQSINIRTPRKKDAFTEEESANLRDSERETHSFMATEIITPQHLCNVLSVSLIVIVMAESSDALHTGSQISPKDLLQPGEPH